MTHEIEMYFAVQNVSPHQTIETETVENEDFSFHFPKQTHTHRDTHGGLPCIHMGLSLSDMGADPC